MDVSYSFVEIESCRAVLQSILPDGLSCAIDWIQKDESVVFEDEAAVVKLANAHRKNEFLAGRRLSREVLGEKQAILIDEDGLPFWPDGQIASISHSRRLCGVVAGASASYVYLGFDLEKTNRLSPEAIQRVVHPLEADFVGEEQLKASLLFCLKEAFYKAQFPRWRTTANFQDLALDVDFSNGSATVLKLAGSFHPELKQATSELSFRFGFCGRYVFSICCLKY